MVVVVVEGGGTCRGHDAEENVSDGISSQFTRIERLNNSGNRPLIRSESTHDALFQK